LAIMGVVVIFWGVFHQNGSALTYWAKNNTNRELSISGQKIINTIAKTEEVSTIPREREIVGLHGEDLGTQLGSSYYYDNYTRKLPQGNLIEKPTDITPEHWENIKEEAYKYGSHKLWPTELQASINPFFVIALTPLIVTFFSFLGRRRKEPTTPAKIALGMLISGLSWIVMIVAALISKNGLEKASALWLFGVYGVITMGELCLSPMGLSLVSKMAPKRIAALMMGGWFLATAIGNKLSGVLSGFWDMFDKKAYFFLTNAILTLVAFIAIALILPWLNKVYHESQIKKSQE